MARIIRGKKFISRSEAAQAAGVSRREIDRWIRKGVPNVVNLKLRVIFIGTLRRVYIREDTFEQFMADKRACDAVLEVFSRPAPGYVPRRERPLKVTGREIMFRIPRY